VAVLRLTLIYLATVGLAGLLWRQPLVLTLCYVVLSALILWTWHSRGDLIFYVVPFVLGPLAEIVAVALGAWSYSQTAWLIPPWLPFAWGIAVLFVYRIARMVAAEPPT
jgi:uncharacterized membrane protein YoaT (DUF817 family)